MKGKQMTDAPEVMWVFPKKDWFNAGASTHPIAVRKGAKDVKYIRSDLADLVTFAKGPNKRDRGYRAEVKGKQMTDLTKIEKPYVLCTKEEQEGLRGLLHTPEALQHLGVEGRWDKLLCWDNSLMPHLTYRQNPAWQPPTLDIPDWFWEATDFNYVAMDENREVFAYKYKPCDWSSVWNDRRADDGAFDAGDIRLDNVFNRHDFNPHDIPWDKSLTVRPGLEK